MSIFLLTLYIVLNKSKEKNGNFYFVGPTAKEGFLHVQEKDS